MKTIVIDPGHGGTDPGAVFGNRYEKNDNLKMALAVQSILKNRGQNVILTRDTDKYVSLEERVRIANNNNADLFISLHRNAYTNNLANGVENFVIINPSQTTLTYAQNVLDRVVGVGVQSNRGISQANFYVLKNTNAPAQLLELGFITNPTDNMLFDQNFDKYVQAIADGILVSLGEYNTQPPAPSGGDPVIKAIQQTLNDRYNTGLVVDGIFGPSTRKALVIGLQAELNKLYNANLTVDGIFGAKTKAAIPAVKYGARNNLVYILQSMLYVNGFKTIPDGIFGANTQAAVRNFQLSRGLSVDGIAGPNTFAALV